MFFSKTLTNVLVLYIPIAALADPKVIQARDNLVKQAGGATGVIGNGVWYDSQGGQHIDEVDIVTVYYAQETQVSVLPLVQALHAFGEQAVLVVDNGEAITYEQGEPPADPLDGPVVFPQRHS